MSGKVSLTASCERFPPVLRIQFAAAEHAFAGLGSRSLARQA